MSAAAENLAVPVRGGDLRGGIWHGEADGPVVVAIHGITSNHLVWAKVAERLAPEITLAAPDLRGRVRSAGLPGPWGMRSHAEDVVAILDHLGLYEAVLAGHSMGAWVALMVARQHPERVARLVLVDGGISLPVPDGLSNDEVLAAILGPALERLRATFASRDAYLATWAEHPAFTGGFDRATREYLLADLAGSGFLWRSSVRDDAVRTDGAELLADDEVRSAIDAVLALSRVPITLLRAPRGLMDDPAPLIPESAAAPYADAGVELITVADTNHYSIVLGDSGADVVAEAITGAVATDAKHPTRSTTTHAKRSEAS